MISHVSHTPRHRSGDPLKRESGFAQAVFPSTENGDGRTFTNATAPKQFQKGTLFRGVEEKVAIVIST